MKKIATCAALITGAMWFGQGDITDTFAPNTQTIASQHSAQGPDRVELVDIPTQYSFLEQYQPEVEVFVDHYNSHLGVNMDPRLIYAMIVVESGGHRNRSNEFENAFDYDPLSMAHQGNPLLDVILEGEEHMHHLGDFSDIDVDKAVWQNGAWNYEHATQDPELLLHLGIVGVFHKTVRRNYVDGQLQVVGMRTPMQGALRYNGGGDPNYQSKLEEVLEDF